RNNREFGGRSPAVKWIRKVLHPLKPLFDHNLSAPLNTLLKPIQEMDRQSEFGERHVLLSLAPQLLEGFNFNRRHHFDSVVRNPVGCRLLRESLSAVVEFPALLPSFTFFPSGSHPYYRLMMVLGVVPDLYYALPLYRPKGDYGPVIAQAAQTEWYPVKSGSPALSLKLQLPVATPNSDFSLMLAIGVGMGSVGTGGSITGVRYAGSGKILAMR
ncbi:MAG TPA: hypothetical protein VEV15_04435, partial [Flavisolibacter sp.]|nr:hypothetical protein [Flavisolibacter sp.]